MTFVPLSWLELSGRPTNGRSWLLLHPVPGKLYQVLASTNLTNWFNLGPVTSTNTIIPFQDTTATSRSRFYRLHE